MCSVWVCLCVLCAFTLPQPDVFLVCFFGFRTASDLLSPRPSYQLLWCLLLVCKFTVFLLFLNANRRRGCMLLKINIYKTWTCQPWYGQVLYSSISLQRDDRNINTTKKNQWTVEQKIRETKNRRIHINLHTHYLYILIHTNINLGELR